MARKYKYVVKKIENRSEACPYKTHMTWDVYRVDPKEDSFEFFAECERRSDAVLIAKTLNKKG